MSDPVVELRGVDFAYDDAPVLESVDLAVDADDFLCVIGPNGGGKTTLLKLMLGLLAPTAGSVRVFGRPPRAVRPRIGYVPQHQQYDPKFPVTVRDVVGMGRLGHGRFGWWGRHGRAAVAEALEQAEVAELAKRPFHTLSGGQRQRTLLARALACEPSLLLLDEPTSNVDAAAQQRLLEMLRRLHERMTLLLVSHDVGFVTRFADRIACVNRRLVTHPVSELTGETIREIYGSDIDLVRHDHHCAQSGHRCMTS